MTKAKCKYLDERAGRVKRPNVVLLAILLSGIAITAAAAEQSERASLWLDVYRGEPVAYEDVLDDLATVGVIYLGERHRLERHHEFQCRIVADLAAKDVALVLALEQMEVHHQPTLNRYAAGKIDFDELAEQIDWSQRWRSYEQYRPVLEAARKAGAPILALNARRETISAVFRKGGLDKLDEETRGELPAKMQLDDPAYEKLLGILLNVHLAATPKWMRPMIEAQIARDEHMAQVLADFLKSPQGNNRAAIVLVGSGHVNYGLGLPARVRKRMPEGKDRIVIMSESGDVELSEEEKAASREIEVSHEQLRAIDRPIADYLHLTEPKG